MLEFKTYFAGSLFKFGDLAGNVLLAEAVRARSNGEFVCVLPQDFEPREFNPRSIRDADLSLLLSCDCALLCFDGLELDSGTVAELLFAKAVDMPCVLFRTDFRGGGDQGPSGEPWNLMCSFLPRVKTALFNSMAVYKSLLKSGVPNLVEALASEAAGLAVPALREAVASKPLEKGGPEGALNVLRWAVRSHGESFERLCSETPGLLEKLAERKISKGLL